MRLAAEVHNHCKGLVVKIASRSIFVANAGSALEAACCARDGISEL